MNRYVNKMVKILDALQVKLSGIAVQKQVNAQTYQDHENMNAELATQANTLVKKAKTQLTDIMNDVALRLARWGCMSVRNLPADSKLFTDNIAMSQHDIQTMVQIHRDNYSMIQVIKAYVGRNNITGIEFPPTAQEQLETYEKFYNGACAMADTLLTNPQANLNDFANPVFCERLFNIVGEGNILSDPMLLNYLVSEPLKTYRYIEDDNFGFDFKPVQRKSIDF